MCKETFLRLPEEKRARVLNAAWDEFTAVSFADASINRIVRAAGIPRGSFYQYFEDKSDLFHDLVSRLHDELAEQLRQLLTDCGGNLFQAALMGYDRFQSEQRRGNEIPVFDRCIRLAKANSNMDLEALGRLHHPQKARIIREFLEGVDKSPFRRQDTRFLSRICRMAGMCLFAAVMDCLAEPGEASERRRELLDELEILRRGSYSEEALRDAECQEATPRGADDAERRETTPRDAERREGGFS